MDVEIPQEVQDYAKGWSERYDYVDNFRFAIKGDRYTQAKYEEAKRHGCCGAIDYQMVPFLVNGNQWYFGFNHGH